MAFAIDQSLVSSLGQPPVRSPTMYIDSIFTGSGMTSCLTASSVSVCSSVLAVNVRVYVPAGYSSVPNTKLALPSAGSS